MSASVLDRPEVEKHLQDSGIALVRADWTHHDDDIAKTLAELGRSGVPAYALYPADAGQPPVLLPEVLTSSILYDAVDKLARRPLTTALPPGPRTVTTPDSVSTLPVRDHCFPGRVYTSEVRNAKTMKTLSYFSSNPAGCFALGDGHAVRSATGSAGAQNPAATQAPPVGSQGSSADPGECASRCRHPRGTPGCGGVDRAAGRR